MSKDNGSLRQQLYMFVQYCLQIILSKLFSTPIHLILVQFLPLISINVFRNYKSKFARFSEHVAFNSFECGHRHLPHCGCVKEQSCRLFRLYRAPKMLLLISGGHTNLFTTQSVVSFAKNYYWIWVLAEFFFSFFLSI